MEQWLLAVINEVVTLEGLQILFLLVLLRMMRNTKINNGQLEQRIKYYIEDAMTRLDYRTEKRAQRHPKDNAGQLKGFETGQRVPGFPYVEDL